MLRIICFVFGILLLTACEKYRLKQPAFISFGWGYKNNSGSANIDNVTLENVKFYLTDFTVSGIRSKGEDVFMTKPTPDDVEFSITGTSSIGLGIDVPVGEYKTFVLTLNIPKKSSGLVLRGTHFNGTENIAVKVEWTEDLNINFSTSLPFELKKKNSYQMELGLDVAKLFEDISENNWTNAGIFNENGVPTYVINPTNNQLLFSKINNALEEAVYLTAP